MKTMIANMKKRKGFTLVEVIIVLVIIAILAAVLIPSLTGYIDKANQKVAVTNARNFTMAAQTIASEAYAQAKGGLATGSGPANFIKDTYDLAELADDASFVAVTLTSNGKVKQVVFYDKTFVVVYSGGSFTTYTSATLPSDVATLPTGDTCTVVAS